MTAAFAATMKPNLIDRVVGYVDPKKGLERIRARGAMAMMGAYSGASKSRRQLQNWNPFGTDPDSELAFDLPILRDRCRDLARNEPIATGAVNTMCTNVVGTGLRLQSRIDANTLRYSDAQAEKLEAAIQREWNYFADSPECDVARTLDFYGLQEMAFRSNYVAGDVFALTPYVQRPGFIYGLKIQLIEGDRISNPNYKPNTDTLFDGVEKDAAGAPIAYHISKRHPGNMTAPMKGMEWNKVNAFGTKTGRRTVLHIYRPLRPGQTRGVPALAAVIETLKQMGRYTDAEVQAAVMSAMLAVFIETPSGDGIPDLNETDTSGATTREKPKPVSTLESGMMIDLAPGEKANSLTPGRPNPAFDPFVQSILQQVGVALEIPYSLLVKRFTASYSAARAELLEAWRAFSTRREWFAAAFCQPIFEAFMDEAVARERIKAPGYFMDPMIRRAVLGSRWVGPGRGMINEKDEVAAAQNRIAAGFSTYTSECAQMGEDFDDVVKQRRKERGQIEAAGLTFHVLANPQNTGSPQTPPDNGGSDSEAN